MNETNDAINESSENFEEMLENSLDRSDNFSVGDRVSGTIVFITEDSAFIDISGKSEAVIDRIEFTDEKGDLTVKKGDSITAYVVSTKSGEIQLTSKIGKGMINSEVLNSAFQNEIPVEGTVTATIKGGYSVSVSGTRCFCPFSQIDLKAPSDPEELINNKYSFKIIKFEERGRNVIISRRVLLEDERKINQDKLKETLNENDIVEATVGSIQKFGIFADIGGIEALIPKSEISWSRHADLNSYSPGQKLNIKIMSIDWVEGKISASLKKLIPEPWENISSYSEGQTISGKIVNIIKVGAFMEIEPGLEGFIHISKMSPVKRINKPEDAVSRGDIVNASILSINRDEKKISLELLTDEANPWLNISDDLEKIILTGTIEVSRPSGINVRLTNGMLGFVPRRELAASANSDIQKEYQVGSEIKITIKDIDRDKKNLILTETGAIKKEERDDYSKFIGQDSSSGGSSLGNLFKDKFDEMKKNIGE